MRKTVLKFLKKVVDYDNPIDKRSYYQRLKKQWKLMSDEEKRNFRDKYSCVK